VVVAVAILFAVPIVSDQVKAAAAKAPGYVNTLRAKIEPLYQRLNLRYPEQTAEARVRIVEAVKNHLPEIVGPVTRAIQGTFSSALAFVLTILNLVVIPVFTVYLLYDMNHIQQGIKELVPWRLRGYVYSRMGEVGWLLSAFVRGQVTVCLILGLFYAISLSLVGVPLGLVVGFVIGFFNLIPFMSYVLGLPLALLLAWLDDPSLTRLVVVAAIFSFGQFVEGNFISPRIVGESLGLHAVVIMLAVLVGGTLFGFPGMILAVPTTAALSVFWSDLKAAYLRSAFYTEGASPPEDEPIQPA
jgi:predicted PurR-regulated permease PerM